MFGAEKKIRELIVFHFIKGINPQRTAKQLKATGIISGEGGYGVGIEVGNHMMFGILQGEDVSHLILWVLDGKDKVQLSKGAWESMQEKKAFPVSDRDLEFMREKIKNGNIKIN